MLAALAVAASGCDGDGGTPADETPTAGDTPAADGGGDGEDLERLESLAGQSTEGVIAKVTYRVTGSSDGDTFLGEWVLAQRPPDSRFEISTDDGGDAFRTIIISTQGRAYLCFSGGGEESCIETTTEETSTETAPFDPIFDIPRELAQDIEGVELRSFSRRTIAGIDANCFEVSSTLADLGEGEVCFSDEGLLLLVRSDVAGEVFSFEAVEASTDVTDEDFEPPYDVIEIPDFDFDFDE